MERDEAIKSIKASLKARSGKAWSVRGGRGTAWGWITISAPPARCGKFGYMTDADRGELAALLGLETIHQQGEQIPASGAYRREYADRAAGITPTTRGTQYWD